MAAYGFPMKMTESQTTTNPINEPAMTTDWATYWEKKGGRRESAHRPRAQWNNYRWRGVYLITIVTHKRKRAFGELNGNPLNAHIELTNIGKAVEQQWLKIPAIQTRHNRKVSLLCHQVMPDHFHGVIRVDAELDVALGEIIRGFKMGCTKEWRRLNQPYMADYHLADTLESAETKAALARMSHKQREAFYQAQGAEPLFDDNYDDTVCFREGQAENAIRYVHDNPRRLALKRANPQLFRLHQRVQVAGYACTTLGNQFLLDFPMKGVVQCSRRLTQQEIDKKKEQCIEEAERGTVFVSAGISEGEKQICKALREEGYPLIILLKDGFPKEADPQYTYFKPQGVYFEACAAGQLLLVEPSDELYESKDTERQVFAKTGAIPHDTLRYRFLALNELTKNCASACAAERFKM